MRKTINKESQGPQSSQKGTLLSRLFRYFRPIWEGSDNKPSGKRILGIILIVIGIHFANYGIKHSVDRLDSIIGLVATVFATALAFWGITAVADFKNRQMSEQYPDNDDNELTP